MKHAMMLCAVLLLLGLAAAPAQSQACPFNVTFTSYGSPCSTVSAQLPSLTGFFPSGSGCNAGLFYDVPPVCCNVLLTNRWLVAGFSPVSVPLPGGGCPLLASADVLIALPAVEGTIALTLILPPDPILIGTTIYLQGVDRRLVTIGLTTHIETTNGLRMDIL